MGNEYGMDHFTDNEAMTWYALAKMILQENHLEGTVKLDKAKNYRIFAKRLENSII